MAKRSKGDGAREATVASANVDCCGKCARFLEAGSPPVRRWAHLANRAAGYGLAEVVTEALGSITSGGVDKVVVASVGDEQLALRIEAQVVRTHQLARTNDPSPRGPAGSIRRAGFYQKSENTRHDSLTLFDNKVTIYTREFDVFNCSARPVDL